MRAAIGLIALLFVMSAACVVAGVALLAGEAWGLIAAGAFLFGAAVVLRMGLTRNG